MSYPVAYAILSSLVIWRNGVLAHKFELRKSSAQGTLLLSWTNTYLRFDRLMKQN